MHCSPSARCTSEYGHIQEIIVQNFRAKADTKMADAPEPDLDDLLWTIAVARHHLRAGMNIQAPPNLSHDEYPRPGRRRPQRLGRRLAGHARSREPGGSLATPRTAAREHRACGKVLTERLAVYPSYALESARWQDPAMATAVIRAVDSDGLRARRMTGRPATPSTHHRRITSPRCSRRTASPTRPRAAWRHPRPRRRRQRTLREADIVALFRGPRRRLPPRLRGGRRACAPPSIGDTVTYVVNRNINYTNICYFKCQFCAFSKGKLSESLRGTPYDLGLRRDRPPRKGGLGARRHGSLHAGRHPS